MKKLILFLVLLAGCAKEPMYETMIVPANDHYSNPREKRIIWNPVSISFEVVVDESWIYDYVPDNGMNKIMGLSWGHHQKNSSARLAYMCVDRWILLGGYCYVNGESPQDNDSLKTLFANVHVGDTLLCDIVRSKDKYMFYINDELMWSCRAGKNKKWGYVLNPYIGGTFTVDHDVKFQIKQL